jgi:putative ABC transport system permease protein
MLKNHLKIALRNLYRQKGYTFINIAGLAVALAICLIIGLFVWDKLSYDRHFSNADRLFRVLQTGPWGSIAAVPPGLANAAENLFPEIEYATVVGYVNRRLFTRDGDRIFVDEVVTADKNFFKVFPFRFRQGSPETALLRPNRMVITRPLAQRLFGEENAIGKIIQIDNQAYYEITAVIDDVPENTHFRFEAVLSLPESRQKERFGETVKWRFYGDHLYLSLAPGATPAFIESTFTDWGKQNRTLDSKDWQLILQPVTSIHLYSRAGNEIAPQSDIQYVYLFSVLAILVLAIACFNYMNLATARYARRANEVGIRKVVGASRAQVARQFIVEAVLLSMMTLPLALLLVEITLPAIQREFGVEIGFNIWQYPEKILALALLMLIVGVGSGSYPALFLSKLKPVKMLGGRLPGFGSAVLFRKVLVVVQFGASLVLLISTIIIHAQINYIHNKRLGFEKDYVVTFSSRQLGDHYETFKQEILASPAIQAVSSGPPTGIGWKNMSMQLGSKPEDEAQYLGFIFVDHDYFETMGLHLVAGRSFSKTFPTDEQEAVILTESAARALGIAEEPLNQWIDVGDEKKKVIGIVEDFHNRSLRSPLEFIVFALDPGNNYTALVRLQPNGVEQGLEHIKQTWARFVPDWPFEFRFLSERIARQYRTEQRMGKIFILFSSLAIFIACLGLFGLAAYTAEQRTKEIGIRKVLGATVANVVALLSKDFVKLVLLANVFAWPVAWVAMNRWLQVFAYRIEISWWVFALAGGLALVIALLTVSWQAIQAALANPVESLRYE